MPIIRPSDPSTIVETTSEKEVTGATRMVRLSDTAGLSQFGAFVETLHPGARSSLRHWHATQDEFIYMLDGQVTAHEGPAATQLFPGDVACFKAGVAVGHFLQNDSGADCSYLVVGTRTPSDTITYPDHDRVLWFDDETGQESLTTLDGRPDAGSLYRAPGT